MHSKSACLHLQVAEQLHGLAVLAAGAQGLALTPPRAAGGPGLGWWGWAPPQVLPLSMSGAQQETKYGTTHEFFNALLHAW